MQPWIAGEVLWGTGMCCLWNSGYDVSSRKDYALEAPQCHKCLISKGAVNSQQRLMFPMEGLVGFIFWKVCPLDCCNVLLYMSLPLFFVLLCNVTITYH